MVCKYKGQEEPICNNVTRYIGKTTSKKYSVYLLQATWPLYIHTTWAKPTLDTTKRQWNSQQVHTTHSIHKHYSKTSPDADVVTMKCTPAMKCINVICCSTAVKQMLLLSKMSKRNQRRQLVLQSHLCSCNSIWIEEVNNCQTLYLHLITFGCRCNACH